MIKAKLSIILFFIFGFAIGQNWTVQHKITASDRHADDRFGSAIAISGNFAVVGSPLHDFDNFNENPVHNSGAAYVYAKNSDNEWAFYQKITANERHNDAQFAYSVAIKDETILIGAHQESLDENNNNFINKAGAAYVFKLNENGKWNQTQKIVSINRDANDAFAHAVSITNEYIILSALTESYDENGANEKEDAGAVYIYRTDNSNQWSFHQKIVAQDRDQYDLFGTSIATDGDQLVVGAVYEDHDINGNNFVSGSGSAYVFEKNSLGFWFETQKLVAPVRLGKDLFACAVAINNNTLVIGAKNCATNEDDTNPINNAGAAYVFKRSLNNQWIFDQKIVARDRMINDAFGVSVAISSKYIMVGAENQNLHNETSFISNAGAVYSYIETNDEEWLQSQKIVSDPRNEHSYFGHAIALEEYEAMFTAFKDDFDNNETNAITDAGAFYTFTTHEIVFDYLDAEICENQSILLEGQERNESGSYFDFNYIDEDIYHYTITNLIINDLPSPVINNTLGTLGTTMSYATYQWYLNDIEIEGANSANYVPTSIGEYSVAVFNDDNCEGRSEAYFFNHNLSIDEFDTAFHIYPNPAKNHIYIGNESWKGSLRLLQMNGQEIAHWETEIVGKKIFNLPSLDQGMYILQLESKEGIITHKRLRIIN